MEIVKRNGKIKEFDKRKIMKAVMKACIEIDDYIDLKKLEEIAEGIEEKCKELKSTPTVEQVQDMVELSLAKDYSKIAVAYIRYRDQQNIKRAKGWDLNELGRRIYAKKYRYGNETFDEFLDRVSGSNDKVRKLIRDKKFLFGGRILANRGTGRKVSYSNCYVTPRVEDNIENIWDVAKWDARTFSYGGGSGTDLAKLRPAGMKVNNSSEFTTGSVSFMELYNCTTNLIGQKGRRGAKMISHHIKHPDIFDFIKAKQNSDMITKANISIRTTDNFMNAVENDDMWQLYFKCTDSGEEMKKSVHAANLYNAICKSNWDWAEPGLLFWDRIKNWCLTSNDERIKFSGVNPCGEEPLPPFGACLLGSINLAEYVEKQFTKEAYVNFDKLNDDIFTIVEAMNEVLDEGIPKHPIQEQREMAANWRQIGIGIMGLADMFLKLGFQYGDKSSKRVSDLLGYLMINASVYASAMLAKRDGSYPMYDYDKISKSDFFKSLNDEVQDAVRDYGLRNSQLLTIAPTGSISNMLGISGGIEPIYNIKYMRRVESLGDAEEYYEVYTPVVQHFLDSFTDKTEEDIITAMTINWKDRIDMQAIWQKYIDASISSTLNLPESATVDEVKDMYMYGWKSGLKGMTIYRTGCKREGILTEVIKKNPEVKSKDVCPECGTAMNHTGGCAECPQCGYSPCSV